MAKFDWDDFEELRALMNDRDVAVHQYEAIASELARHRATVETLEDKIEALAVKLPDDVASVVREKAKRDKPWK